MTVRLFRLFCSALAFSALACTAHAQQFAPPIGGGQPVGVASFTIPQSTDPGVLTITQEGQTYTNLDGQAPGDQLGGPITGLQLTTGNPFIGAGIEIHGKLPQTLPNTQIREVDLFTTYTGPLSAMTFADFNAVPWDVTRINPAPGFFQGFRFTATDPNSVPIDNYLDPNFNFALLVVTFPRGTSMADMDFFNASTFGVQGFVTPEPGTIALFGALIVSGGAMFRRRRRTV